MPREARALTEVIPYGLELAFSGGMIPCDQQW